MQTQDNKYRLLTRSDFDGLVCAILLKELGMLGTIKFVHPKDVQDGKIEVTDRDILTNLPYVAGCKLCFDHHASEEIRTAEIEADNHVLSSHADSAARVVYDYFGGADRFPEINVDMLEAVDKADAARFSMDDVLAPQGWELLSFLMDARTGLGRFREFRVSNYQLMMDLIDYCKEHSIDEILALPDVQERVEVYRAHEGPVPGPAAPLRDGARQPGSTGFARRRNDFRRQPFHDLRVVPRVQHFDARAVGPEEAKHGVYDWQVHF